MKKILTHLTGIVFLIAVLAAGSCNRGTNQKEEEEAGDAPKQVKQDSTQIVIFLKAVLINGSMHLEMYESKKPSCPVIDGLITVVYPGYTVTWKKADNSIKKVESIRPITDDGTIFGNDFQEIEAESLWTLEIPGTAKPGTIKYEIDFTIKEDKDTTYTIDPYLRIPRE